MITNRRDFIFGAMAAAGAAGCRSLAPARDDGGRILFGACRSSVEDVTVMRDVGFDFWEGGVGGVLDPKKDDEWWKRQKDEIAKRPLPLRCCNGFIPWGFRLTGPAADFAPALAYAEKALRRADEIGVKAIVFGSGGARNVPGDFSTKNPPDTEKGTRQFTEFCRQLAARVEDLKTVQVVIEPLRPKESNIINYVFQGLAICREVNSPRLMQLADIFHMMMGGDEPAAIVAAGSLLRHLHIAEYDSRLFPGSDPARVERFVPFFDKLKEIGYTGGVSCECGWGEGKDFAKNAKIAIETMKGLV